MSRIAARLLCAAVLSMCVLVGGPIGSASAMCEGDISPVRPDGTPVGWFLSPPNVGQHVDSSGAKVDNDYPSGSPFDDSKVSWSDTFGYGGHWNTYDLGCGPDAAHAPLAGPFTAFGNLVMEIAKFPVAVLSQVQDWLTSDPFSWLDPVTATIAQTFKQNVWLQFFPLSLVVLGLVFIWQSRRADFNATMSATGWALVVITLSVFLLNYPQKANSLMTSAITSGSAVASSPFSNGNFADEVSQYIIYPQWLQGELGSSTSAVAQKYGEDLYAAQHLTWVEAQRVDRAGQAPTSISLPDPNQTPSQREDALLPRQKDEDFKDVAKQVKADDRTAYENLQGLHGENRLAAAVIMSVYTWTASLFMCMALAFLALALLMVRAVVIAAPIAAIVGVHERYRHVLKGILNMFVASLVAVVKFTLAAGVFSLVVSGVIAAPTNQALKLLLVLVSTVVALMVVKPIRTLKTVIPAADPNTSYLKQALGYVVHRKAVEEGVEDGLADARRQAAAPAPPGVASTRAEEESLDPLPTTTSERSEYRIFAEDPNPRDAESASYGSAPASGVSGRHLAHDRQLATVPDPAASPHMHVTGQPSMAGVRLLASSPTPQADAVPTPTPVLVGGPVDATGTTAPPVASERIGVVPRSPVDEHYGDIYSRSEDREHAETLIDDLPLADKQIDANGNEVFVVYRTRNDPDAAVAAQPRRTQKTADT